MASVLFVIFMCVFPSLCSFLFTYFIWLTILLLLVFSFTARKPIHTHICQQNINMWLTYRQIRTPTLAIRIHIWNKTNLVFVCKKKKKKEVQTHLQNCAPKKKKRKQNRRRKPNVITNKTHFFSPLSKATWCVPISLFYEEIFLHRMLRCNQLEINSELTVILIFYLPFFRFRFNWRWEFSRQFYFHFKFYFYFLHNLHSI